MQLTLGASFRVVHVRVQSFMSSCVQRLTSPGTATALPHCYITLYASTQCKVHEREDCLLLPLFLPQLYILYLNLLCYSVIVSASIATITVTIMLSYSCQKLLFLMLTHTSTLAMQCPFSYLPLNNPTAIPDIKPNVSL